MANSLYHNCANKWMGLAAAAHTAPDLDDGNVTCALTDHAADTPVVATDQDYADISAGTVGTPVAMTSATLASGSIDYADFTFTAVSGASCESLNFYSDYTTAANSPLIAHYDTATGLPVTPNGGDINVTLNASGLFKLVA